MHGWTRSAYRWPSWTWPKTTRQRPKQRVIGEFSYAAESWDARAARDHAAGVRRARHQPALHRHQPARRCASAVRPAVLPARRGREPHQGSAAGLCSARARAATFRANQLRLLLAALAYTLMQRLRALALERHRAGARLCRHDPRAAAQDRRGSPAQHAPRARDVRQSPPAARVVRTGRRTAGR